MSGCNKILWGPKRRTLCRCQKACDSMFPSDIQLREGCRAACAAGQSVNNYACEKIGSAQLILSRGYDPCVSGAESVRSANDALNENANKQVQQILGVILLLLGILAMAFIWTR